MAGSFPGYSPYNYVLGNPVRLVDPDGRSPDEIIIDEIYGKDESGNQVVIGYNITVTAKLINFSNNNVDLKQAAADIKSYIEGSFQGEFNGKSVSTSINLSVAETMGDVSESDHLFVLAEPDSGETAGEVNDFGGLAAFLDADSFTGWYDVNFGTGGENTSAHELGHLFNLRHTDSDLMHGLVSDGGRVNPWELENIIGDYKNGVLNQGQNTGANGLPNSHSGITGKAVGLKMTNTNGRH